MLPRMEGWKLNRIVLPNKRKKLFLGGGCVYLSFKIYNKPKNTIGMFYKR